MLDNLLRWTPTILLSVHTENFALFLLIKPLTYIEQFQSLENFNWTMTKKSFVRWKLPISELRIGTVLSFGLFLTDCNKQAASE